MSRRLILVAAIAIVAAGCANPLGRSVPECDTVRGSLVLEVQAVPGAAYVSCINGLKTGWAYRDLEARNGHAVYWLDSDRMGDMFITVESVLSCDVNDARESESGVPSVRLFKDVVSKTTIEIVLVPEGSIGRTLEYAAEIAAELEASTIRGREIVVSVSLANDSTSTRAKKAADAGAHVIIISVRDAEEGTLTLLLNGQPQEYDGDLDQAIDVIEDAEERASYRGSWYHVFEGGCVVYTFDAEGAGVDTIEDDIGLTLGLFDADALRQTARDAGFNLP
jgi:hypothetical protein